MTETSQAKYIVFYRLICLFSIVHDIYIYIYIYSKTRLQKIRWNKSREASTENEEKQKGLNVGKRTTWHDWSLTTIILHSMTNLSHPSYYTKQKGQTEKDWTSEKQ